MNRKPRTPIQTAENSIKLVDVLKADQTPRIAEDIADAMKMSETSIRKYLQRMEKEQVVIVTTSGRYNDKFFYHISRDASIVNGFVDRARIFIEENKHKYEKKVKVKPQPVETNIKIPKWRDDPLIVAVMGERGPSTEQEPFE